jgi:hypothetical protein
VSLIRNQIRPVNGRVVGQNEPDCRTTNGINFWGHGNLKVNGLQKKG